MKETLCWTCSVPGTRGCSWDRAFVPVEGWTATPTRIWLSREQDSMGSFLVHACPLYRPEAYRPAADKHIRNGPQPRLPDEDLIGFLDEGLSDEEIAAMCGMSPHSIYKRRRRIERLHQEGGLIGICIRCARAARITKLIDGSAWCQRCLELTDPEGGDD